LVLAASSFSVLDEAWVSVERPQRVVHTIETDDKSIWVVFIKNFGTERVSIRFPEDPQIYRKDGAFVAKAPYGQGEMYLLVRKSIEPNGNVSDRIVKYQDTESGLFVLERHVKTAENIYVLRMTHPSESLFLFQQFSGSLDVAENPQSSHS
jgi:hypothetical protein